jgi:hypothetical protein
VDIEIIRLRIQQGNYLVKSHAVQHAIKEGFDRKNMVDAVLNGKIIEEYPEDQRALICGHTTLFSNRNFYLHVVCEYADPVYVEFVTAYIPDEMIWENPPTKRRKRQRK